MKRLSALLLLLGTSLLLYAGTLRGGFVWDDEGLILRKAAFFREPGAAARILTSPDMGLYDKPTPYYRPLATLSFLADQRLWGLRPSIYHAESVLLHAAACVLLYLLLLSAFGDPLLAFFSALLFAVHPVNAETVSAVFLRNGLLCGVWMLAALLALHRRTRAWTLASLSLYALALLSKEPGAVLPLFLLSFILLEERRLPEDRLACAGFAAVTAAYLLLRWNALGVLLTDQPAPPAGERWTLILAALAENFRLAVFPLRLNAMVTPQALGFSAAKAAAGLAALAALLALALRRETPRPLRAGALWALWGLLPAANLVPIPSAPVADRYLYLPLMGFALLAGWGLRRLHDRKAALATAAAFLLAAALGARAFERTRHWRSNTSLFQSMIESDPGNHRARYNLGMEHMEAGRLDLAAKEWLECVRLEPSFSNAHNALGNLRAIGGDYPGAKRHYQKALEQASMDALTPYNLAVVCDLLGERGEAARNYRLFLEKSGGSPEPRIQEKAQAARARLAELSD